MANTIKQKRGTTDPGASDLVVGELAINTTDGGVFTKTDGGTVVEVGSGGGASEINDLSDAVTKDGGVTIGLGTGALANDNDTDNDNTALGYNALNANTSGSSNTAVGYLAGQDVTTGYQNSFLGDQAGQNITSGYRNTAAGYTALNAVTTGYRNTGIGYQAGDNITTGYNNTVIGNQADASSATAANEITLGNSSITSLRIPGLQSGASDGQVLTFNSTNGNITLADAGGGGLLTEDANKNIYGGSNTFLNPTLTGSDKADNNVAIGERAMMDITGGDRNVALGQSTMKEITMGMYNVGIGSDACGGNSAAAFTGQDNVAIGRSALDSVTTGRDNVGIGLSVLDKCTTGSYNIAIGKQCLKDTTTGEYNIALGEGSQRYASGSNNISMGYRTAHNISGSNNVLIGPSILTSSSDSLSGSNNTLIGRSASPSSASVNNEMTLGNSNLNTLRCNQTSITSLSDGRDKINVAELGEGLDFVSRLKPVKFEWKTRDGNSKDGTFEAGFIAQDLQQLQKDTDSDYLRLVMDNNPDRLEASYGKLVPILVRAIQELKSEVEQLKANV